MDITFPSTAKGARENQSVVNVSWREAVARAHWLEEQTNNQCHLPTEAEWEYAARAETTTAYPWDIELGSNNANCSGCVSQWDGQQAAPVGDFAANQFGMYDMSGNVWEWACSNWREQLDGIEQQCNDDATDTQFCTVVPGTIIQTTCVRLRATTTIHTTITTISVSGCCVSYTYNKQWLMWN